MDGSDAVMEQLRGALHVAAELGGAGVPRVESWLGPASRAAEEALEELRRMLARAQDGGDDWVRAARRAAADG